MTTSVLVTGGAGYIGSHMVLMLQEQGYEVTVFDNLSRGFIGAVGNAEFVQGDLRQSEDLKGLFENKKFSAVMHFAALAYVGESVQQPRLYYENNVAGTLNLINAMLDHGVRNLVFSSTCSTYGTPDSVPITEKFPQNPINPYGRSKLMMEQLFMDYGKAYGLNSVALRYFNAAGCDSKGRVGERHDPETHLIPLILLEALRVQQGGDCKQTGLAVFGDDFDTEDGTCVRDYIHVTDLCSAHFAALDRLLTGKVENMEAFNLGNGQGFSVKEVIDSCRRVTGVDIQFNVTGRRAGDPAALVGSAEKARQVLGWVPQMTSLDQIVETAWRWMNSSFVK